ncbi:MAG: YfbM family protein [Tannerella sp.]|jgi:hypothetical protein|nr:YfbM family protein [Tannerella sp.]
MGMIGNYIAIESDKLEQVKNNELDILDIDTDEYPSLDIDKSWQAIHFLLCGNIDDGKPPLGNVVPMRDDNWLGAEMDYGAFSITPKEVLEAYNAIKGMGEDELRQKYNFESLLENEIYPVVEDEDPDDFFDYTYANFKSIQEFYQIASENNYAVIFYVM